MLDRNVGLHSAGMPAEKPSKTGKIQLYCWHGVSARVADKTGLAGK
jgi:hypothetical protein